MIKRAAAYITKESAMYALPLLIMTALSISIYSVVLDVNNNLSQILKVVQEGREEQKTMQKRIEILELESSIQKMRIVGIEIQLEKQHESNRQSNP